MSRRRRDRFHKTVFRNGLTLLTERHTEFQSLCIGVWVKAGTRNERASEAGISHFLEHMLFKGTASRSALDIAREVDRVGGDFNAFTTREHTCFHMVTLARDFDLAADILCDVLLNSEFDSEELERERKVILQEIAMTDDAPEELVHDLFFERVYGKRGLGRPILGSHASVRRISRASLRRYFRRHYRAERIVVSVAGNVPHERIRKRFRSLGRMLWPGRDASCGLPGTHHEPDRPATGAWWVARASEQVHLVWGAPGPRYSSRDRVAAYVLNTHLGGGMSSLLFQEIRERNGLAYTVYSSYSPFVDSGLFTTYIATSMGQVPRCLQLLEKCLFEIRDRLLTDDELARVKESLKGTVLLSADGVEARMSSIAQSELYFGRNLSLEEICRAIDAVTAKDIRRVARSMLREGKRSIVALGPAPTPRARRAGGFQVIR